MLDRRALAYGGPSIHTAVLNGLFIGVGFAVKSEECPYNSALQNLDALSGLQVIDKDLWLCGANQCRSMDWTPRSRVNFATP